MNRQSRILHSVVALPVVAMATAVAFQDGGAQPGPSTVTLPTRLSAQLVPFGSTVRAEGRAPQLALGATVRVVHMSDSGITRVLGIAVVRSDHHWQMRFKAKAEGRVAAFGPGALARAASPSQGSRLDLSVAIDSPESVSGRAGTTSRVMVSFGPRARTGWALEHRGRKGWVTIDRGTSDRAGRAMIGLAIGRAGHDYRVRARPASGLTGATGRVIRTRGLRPALASWYGLYGDPVACGGVLGRNQLGVAHKTLPCGTRVTISYRGRTVVAPVIDRGPYIAGREFDLSGAVARRLHFDGVGTVWVSP